MFLYLVIRDPSGIIISWKNPGTFLTRWFCCPVNQTKSGSLRQSPSIDSPDESRALLWRAQGLPYGTYRRYQETLCRATSSKTCEHNVGIDYFIVGINQGQLQLSFCLVVYSLRLVDTYADYVGVTRILGTLLFEKGVGINSIYNYGKGYEPNIVVSSNRLQNLALPLPPSLSIWLLFSLWVILARYWRPRNVLIPLLPPFPRKDLHWLFV